MKLRNLSLVFLTALSISACTKIDSGSVGVKIKTLGDHPGVQNEPLQPGYVITGFGEEVDSFPVIQKNYAFTKDSDKNSDHNEEITFSDKNGSPLSADVSITLRVQPAFAPSIYRKYRLSFEDLLDGQIRNDLRNAINSESEQIPVEQMFGGGRELIIQKALAKLQAKWSKEGIEISQLQWIGQLRLPQAVQDSILARTKADQDQQTALARVAVAEAQAKEKVAIAQGDADAIRIRGEALRSNPQVLQQLAIEKWDGHMPKVTGGSTPFVSLKDLGE